MREDWSCFADSIHHIQHIITVLIGKCFLTLVDAILPIHPQHRVSFDEIAELFYGLEPLFVLEFGS
jgi:hypothetical protein